MAKLNTWVKVLGAAAIALGLFFGASKMETKKEPVTTITTTEEKPFVAAETGTTEAYIAACKEAGGYVPYKSKIAPKCISNKTGREILIETNDGESK